MTRPTPTFDPLGGPLRLVRSALLAVSVFGATLAVDAATPSAQAAVPDIGKVAVVDMQRILNETAAGKKARKDLESSSLAKQKKLDKRRQKLEQAQSMLPTRGFARVDHPILPQHVPIWFALASAHMASGNEEGASRWFQRITDSTTERLAWPIPYVRSFYFLGKIHENRGDMQKAREYYRRFYEFWKDGDMDRERVEEAKRKSES